MGYCANDRTPFSCHLPCNPAKALCSVVSIVWPLLKRCVRSSTPFGVCLCSVLSIVGPLLKHCVRSSAQCGPGLSVSCVRSAPRHTRPFRCIIFILIKTNPYDKTCNKYIKIIFFTRKIKFTNKFNQTVVQIRYCVRFVRIKRPVTILSVNSVSKFTSKSV